MQNQLAQNLLLQGQAQGQQPLNRQAMQLQQQQAPLPQLMKSMKVMKDSFYQAQLDFMSVHFMPTKKKKEKRKFPSNSFHAAF